MELREVINTKKELEASFLKQMQDFEKKTGLGIDSVYLKKIRIEEKCSREKTAVIDFIISVDI